MITNKQRKKIADKFRKYSEHFPNWYSCTTLIALTLNDVLGTDISVVDYESVMGILADLIERKDDNG